MEPIIATSARAHTFVLEEELRILVVDDDPIQREFATVYLGAPCLQIVAVENGAAALEALRERAFDIVLVDYDMPGMNGLALIDHIKRDPQLRHLPLIMVTSHEDIATIDAAYDAGAASFVVKPVNWRLLAYHIRYVMRAQMGWAA